MAVRAFLVAAILVGQLPVRVCTCGDDPDEAAPADPADGHHDDPTDDQPPDGNRHHPDCPAGDPSPVLATARPIPAADAHSYHTPLPTALHHHEPEAVSPRVTPGRHPPAPHAVPLFLSLHVLRN
jgi:hypothetical protein